MIKLIFLFFAGLTVTNTGFASIDCDDLKETVRNELDDGDNMIQQLGKTSISSNRLLFNKIKEALIENLKLRSNEVQQICTWQGEGTIQPLLNKISGKQNEIEQLISTTQHERI